MSNLANLESRAKHSGLNMCFALSVQATAARLDALENDDHVGDALGEDSDDEFILEESEEGTFSHQIPTANDHFSTFLCTRDQGSFSVWLALQLVYVGSVFQMRVQLTGSGRRSRRKEARSGRPVACWLSRKALEALPPC